MKIRTLTILMPACLMMGHAIAQTAVEPLKMLPPEQIRISGYLGQQVDKCISNRISAQSGDELVEPFTQRHELKQWQTEFWGKWVLSAIDAYRYDHDEALKKNIDRSVVKLIATQSTDGYIGNYPDSAHLRGWDIWGRKYVMLGLLSYYDLTGKKEVLTAACKLADHLMTEVGPGKVNIVKTGAYRGMPSCSILEPIVLLYNHTKTDRYLKFAEYIVQQWETPDGPQLISKALAGTAVGKRFPAAKNWWSWENGEKAYEMMSCYDGLLELYKIDHDPRYLKAIELTADNIARTEINIAGGGAANECWYSGAARQTTPSYLTMETCVTQTWMKLCAKLLAVTHNPIYADHIETSYYNALLGAMSADGSTFAKYTSLTGSREYGENQCGMNIHCCSANGPRGIMLFPSAAIMTGKDALYLNFYSNSIAKIKTSFAGNVTVQQVTDYPKTDMIEFNIDPDAPATFTIDLRIPAWSAVSSLSVNGENVPATPGTYIAVKRQWKKGDKVILKLDMRGRINTLNGYTAITRGPILLSRDTRLAESLFIDEEGMPQAKNGYITLKEKTIDAGKIWMAFTAPFKMGSIKEGAKAMADIPFCNFSSAGNNWDEKDRLRVWTLQPIDVKIQGQ